MEGVIKNMGGATETQEDIGKRKLRRVFSPVSYFFVCCSYMFSETNQESRLFNTGRKRKYVSVWFLFF